MLVETIFAGSLLGAFLQTVFGKMPYGRMLDFFREQQLDVNLLMSLRSTLLAVNAVLTDAEAKQITNPAVKEWLDELRDVVYDVEDLLDEISTEASQLQSSEDRAGLQLSQGQVNSFNSGLKSIMDKLDPILKHKDVLHLQEGGGVKPPQRMPTTSLVDQVFGRNADRDKILEFLLSGRIDGSEIPVTAIVGIGGVGKTTLAQLLYNDWRVAKHFELRAWAYVSEDFDIFKVTRTIYESITSSNCGTSDLNVLQLKIRERLMGQRFLLVLDDFWNEDFVAWDVLKRPFRAGACGSRIIITTRSQGVASILGAHLTHPLPELPFADSLLLFEKHAFGNGNSQGYPTLKAIGEEIVKKCSGLPLAVKTIGASLRSKVVAEEWKHVLNSKLWHLPNGILPALRLSYYHLSSHLKRCFAYCSIFPKGFEIERGNLVRLWIAEGLVSHSKGSIRMREVGEHYFHELVSRSLFQQSKKDKSCFMMHDLVNDLAQHVAGEFCFRFEDGNPHEISGKARHISYSVHRFGSPYFFEDLYEEKRVRTFLPVKSSAGAPVFSPTLIENLSTMSCLRVLSLSAYRHCINTLPDSIGRLRRLRYLDLSLTLITQLPETVGSLCNLETLMLLHCKRLAQLPRSTSDLINLQHLDIAGTMFTEMPPNFGNLRSLQLLTYFVVGANGGSRISELEKLSHLHGSLSILELQNANSTEALEANLKEKQHVHELLFRWARNFNNDQAARDVLTQLRPHVNLKKLTIEGYCGQNFPYWLNDFSCSNLVSLTLRDCNCSSLPPLGQLPKLEKLYVARMKEIRNVDARFYGNNSFKQFQSLKSMTFDGLSEWKDWIPCANKSEAFPSLEELVLLDCPLLGGLPLSCLTSLKVLHIHDCGNLALQTDDTSLHCTALRNLHISSCDLIMSLPLNSFTRLENLKINNCGSLNFLGVSQNFQGNMTFLQHLEIDNCENLRSFDGRGLSSLQRLTISDCAELNKFIAAGSLSSLESLSIQNCHELTPRMDWAMQNLCSLKSFRIKGGCRTVEFFPEEGLLPASLISLEIDGLQDLQSLDHQGLQYLTSLEKLEIHNCSRLERISNERLPDSVSSLTIKGCVLLIPLFRAGSGQEWEKICHIPDRDIGD